MRGIPEERLKVIAAMPASVFEAPASEIINYLIAKECQELQEPWMTLDQFLKSGFRGRCWINFRNERVDFCRFLDGTFFNDETGFSVRRDFIVKVMPIHKPEPPR